MALHWRTYNYGFSIFLWISGFFLGEIMVREKWEWYDTATTSIWPALVWNVIMDGKVNGTKRFKAEPLKFWVPYFQIKSWNQVQNWWHFHVIPFASQHLLGKNRWEAARRWIVMVTTCTVAAATAVPCRCSLNACFLWHGQGSLVSSPWAKKGGGNWGKGKEVFHGVSESCGAHGTSQSDITRILITHTHKP